MSLDFVTLDFETANSFRGSACSIGMAKYIGGAFVESYESYLKPVTPSWDADAEPLESLFSKHNVSIHGITPSSVADAPAFYEAFPEIYSWIDGLPVVAHNASFDMGVLRDALKDANMEWPSIDYACTLVLSRKTFDLPSYKLAFVSEAAGLPFDEAAHHDAFYDASVTGFIMSAIANHHGASSVEETCKAVNVSMGHINASSWAGCKVAGSSWRAFTNHGSPKDIIINETANPEHPLYGIGVTFTGTLTSMTRSEAWESVAAFGGTPLSGVSKKTHFLVFGEQEAAFLRPGATMSSKFEKAIELRAKGVDIEVISENDFLSMLAESASSGNRL